jgi:hypothetical protein
MTARIRIENIRATLLGIDCTFAWANRKYHPGLIWGVYWGDLQVYSCVNPPEDQEKIRLALVVLGIGLGSQNIFNRM